MAAVTISASYGAGGGIIGPLVADRLGVPFYDRAITVEVARRLGVPAREVAARESHAERGLARLIALFAPIGGFSGGPIAPPVGCDDEDYRRQVDAVVRQAADLDAVILGRGGAVILRERPGTLHVRLTGPAERRRAQAAALRNISAEEAARQQRHVDHLRTFYARQFHHVDPTDARLYHLILDSTAIPFDVCVEMILKAARGLR